MAVFAVSLDDDPAREEELIATLLRRRVDALILTTVTANQSYLRPEVSRGIPVVFLDREPVGIEADIVVSDNRDGAFRATQHLTAFGHRRIAFLGDNTGIRTEQQRRQGFLDGIAEAGIRPSSVILRDGIEDETKSQRVVEELLDGPEPPTAIFSSQNLITVGAIRALHGRNREHEIALVGFDDIVLADMVRPGITVVAQNPAAIGRLAAERALARLDGDTSPFLKHTIETTLIPRGSGEIPPERAP